LASHLLSRGQLQFRARRFWIQCQVCFLNTS
jgi:hypothetical protein